MKHYMQLANSIADSFLSWNSTFFLQIYCYFNRFETRIDLHLRIGVTFSYSNAVTLKYFF